MASSIRRTGERLIAVDDGETSPLGSATQRPANRGDGQSDDGGAESTGLTRHDGDAASEPSPLRPLEVLVQMGQLGLVGLVVLFGVYHARPFLLPVLLAVLLGSLLWPLVEGMVRLGVPRRLGAALVLIALVCLSVLGVRRTLEPARSWLERAPRDLRRVEMKLRQIIEPVEELSEAAQQVEEMTQVGGRRVERVVVGEPSLGRLVMSTTRETMAVVATVIILLFFLLGSRGLFLRRLALVAPGFAQRRRALRIIYRTQSQLARLLATITLINLGLGLAIGTSMYLLGVPSPILWGLMATVLNFVPYLGALAGVATMTVVSFVTFDEVARAVIPPLAYLGLTSLEGGFLTPLILGRSLSLSPVAILLGLLFWGWLWGIPGALLAVPILLSTKIACDNVPSLSWLGQLLARGRLRTVSSAPRPLPRRT